MRCPRCDADTPEGTKFCIECGTPLTPRCPQCGADTLPRAKFCGECGTPLAAQSPASLTIPDPPPRRYTPGYLAEKILTAKTALEGERKQVTVLFADLKGSMELLADRDPEEARHLLDPVLERMMAAVHRYEGTVNQVMGDGIMALFGAPIAHEDHAIRACYAALRMQESVKAYAVEVQRTQGVPRHIRVGLNAGEVVVRAIGSDLRMDYGRRADDAPGGAHGADGAAGLHPDHPGCAGVGGRLCAGQSAGSGHHQGVGQAGGSLRSDRCGAGADAPASGRSARIDALRGA
jgi:hypothetical protein